MYSVYLPCCTNIGKETLVQTIVDKINEGLGGIWRIHVILYQGECNANSLLRHMKVYTCIYGSSGSGKSRHNQTASQMESTGPDYLCTLV